MTGYDVVVVGGRVAGAVHRAAAGPGRRSGSRWSSGRATAATRVSTHAPDAGRRPAAVPLGPARPRCVARRAPRRSGGRCFHYPGDRAGAGVDPAEPGRRRALRPAPARPRPRSWSTRRRRRAPTCVHGDDRDRPAPATTAAGSAGVRRGPAPAATLELRARVDGRRRRHPVRRGPRGRGAASTRAGRAAGAVLYRLLRRPARRRLRVGVRRVGGRRADPDQRRADLRLRGHQPRADARAAPRRAPTPPSPTLVAPAAPAFADRRAARPRRSAGPAGWGGVPGFVRRSWGPGWALVGDAGYFKDPITAHGMTDALRDAELLADELLEALAGETARARWRWAATRRTRDRLSHRLFAATEAVAGVRLGRRARCRRCCGRSARR